MAGTVMAKSSRMDWCDCAISALKVLISPLFSATAAASVRFIFTDHMAGAGINQRVELRLSGFQLRRF